MPFLGSDFSKNLQLTFGFFKDLENQISGQSDFKIMKLSEGCNYKITKYSDNL